MKVKDIRKFLEGLDDNDEIYVGYDDHDELEFSLYTEQEIIDRANDQAGLDRTEDGEVFSDIDTALCYLADMDYTYHYMM